MRHLLLLFALLSLTAAFAKEPPGPERWEPEIAAYEKADREKTPEKRGIVFVGSSSIRLWKTLAADFPKHRVLNRGFGGSQIPDSIHFLERLVFPHEPRMVVIYAGGNDLNAGRTPGQVVADFKTLAGKIRARLPETEIAYISIAGNPKRWAQVEKVKAANAAIAEFCGSQPKMKFIDVFPRMLGDDGLPKPEIFVEDRLHMNAEGYKLWTEVVGQHLPSPDK